MTSTSVTTMSTPARAHSANRTRSPTRPAGLARLPPRAAGPRRPNVNIALEDTARKRRENAESAPGGPRPITNLQQHGYNLATVDQTCAGMLSPLVRGRPGHAELYWDSQKERNTALRSKRLVSLTCAALVVGCVFALSAA